MQDYELTIIFNPDLTSDSEVLTEDKIDAMLKKWKVKAKTKEVWGKRIFAYPLKKKREGIYVLLKVSLKPEEVSELESKLRLEEKVLRYLLVRI